MMAMIFGRSARFGLAVWLLALSVASSSSSQSPQVGRDAATVSTDDGQPGERAIQIPGDQQDSAKLEDEFESIDRLMAIPRYQLPLPDQVRVRGLVSSVGEGIASRDLVMPAAANFCIEGDSGGIWVRSSAAIREGFLLQDDELLKRIEPGVEVILQGFVGPGGFAPVILPTKIEIVGRGELPEAPRAKMRRFLSGADVARRVRVSGVVQNIFDEASFRWLVRVETGVGHFLTRLPKTDAYQPSRLLDAEIEMTGLAAVSRNWRSELVCPRFIVGRHEDFRIRKKAPMDPFSVERLPLKSIADYHPDGRPLHRKCIEGTVTLYDGKQLVYVQDAGAGLHVLTHEVVDVEVGDRVEVSGFIDTSRHLAGLQGASVRRLSRGTCPKPVLRTMTGIIEEHVAMAKGHGGSYLTCDGQLVAVEGRVLAFQKGTASFPAHFEIDCGDSVVTAFFSSVAADVAIGTLVRVTGVAKLKFSSPNESANYAMPTSLELVIRGPDDIVVIGPAPWLTLQRVLLALAVVAVVTLSVFAWAFTLRKTLKQRTKQLALEMRSRRDAAIEFQGAIRERTRLAANLHDTLLQTMAGISYQIEACDHRANPDPNEISSHLDLARKMVQHGQDGLRNTVWALHSLPLEEADFSESVRQIIRKIGTNYDKKIHLECAEELPALADFIAGNLLLVIQEGVHNSIKHADSDEIMVCLAVAPDGEHVQLTISDSGKGFDPDSRQSTIDGHFGIEAMQQRIERLGGSIQIESEPGVGTTVKADIPLREFDPEIA